jgi:hypothetical protein
MEGHMRRPIVIAIATGMVSLVASMFWQMDLNARATVANVLAKPDYVVTSNPYLPIEWLRLVW